MVNAAPAVCPSSSQPDGGVGTMMPKSTSGSVMRFGRELSQDVVPRSAASSSDGVFFGSSSGVTRRLGSENGSGRRLISKSQMTGMKDEPSDERKTIWSFEALEVETLISYLKFHKIEMFFLAFSLFLGLKLVLMLNSNWSQNSVRLLGCLTRTAMVRSRKRNWAALWGHLVNSLEWRNCRRCCRKSIWMVTKQNFIKTVFCN